MDSFIPAGQLVTGEGWRGAASGGGAAAPAPAPRACTVRRKAGKQGRSAGPGSTGRRRTQIASCSGQDGGDGDSDSSGSATSPLPPHEVPPGLLAYPLYTAPQPAPAAATVAEALLPPQAEVLAPAAMPPNPNSMDTATPRQSSAPGLLPAHRDRVSELLENAVLFDAGVIQAARAVSKRNERIATCAELTSEAGLRSTLGALQFQIDAEVGWAMLGICPLDGPAPTAEWIETRAALAQDILLQTAALDWTGDPAWGGEVSKRIESSRAICQDALRDVIRRRPKGHGKLARWAEGSKAVLAFLAQLAEPQEIILLQLSDVLGQAADLPAQIPPPAQARVWMEEILLEGPSTILRAGFSGATIWCPSQASEIGRLLTAFNKHAATDDQTATLRLVCPLQLPPGGCNPKACLEL